MHKLTACALALLATTACGDGSDDRCVDGVYDGTAVLVSDGFLFQQYPSLLSPGSREIVPYSAAPFRSCRVLGGILMQSADAVLDSEHYPLLEDLGFITIEPLDNGGPRIVDDISGFDDVVRFGGIGNPWDLERVASVREISGFNDVEVVDGSLEATAILTGFRRLRVVEGTLDVANLAGQTAVERVAGDLELNGSGEEVALPNLESIGGDMLIHGSGLVSVSFPALRGVGGDVTVWGNDRLAVWQGFAEGSSIAGNFEAFGNPRISDAAFEDWVASGVTTISGTVRICANQSEGVRICSDQ